MMSDSSSGVYLLKRCRIICRSSDLSWIVGCGGSPSGLCHECVDISRPEFARNKILDFLLLLRAIGRWTCGEAARVKRRGDGDESCNPR